MICDLYQKIFFTPSEEDLFASYIDLFLIKFLHVDSKYEILKYNGDITKMPCERKELS